MKRFLSMLLVLCMVVTMLPLAVFAEETTLIESQTGLSIPKDEYHTINWTAPANGTVTVEVTAANPGVKFEFVYVGLPEKVAVGTPYEVAVEAGKAYEIHCFGNKGWDDYIATTVSYNIFFTPATGDAEVVKEEYLISEENAFSEAGTYEIKMLNDTALVTLVNFTPAETGKYEFSVGSDAKIKYCGTVNYAFGYDTLAEDGTQTVTWDCSDINQNMLLGIVSESDTVEVTLTRTGDVQIEEILHVVYENKDLAPVDGLPVLGEEEAIADYAKRYNAFRQAYTNKWSVPEDAELGEYVDVLDNETHIAVKDQNGLYRLDREDGPVLLIDMDYNGIILTTALTDPTGRGVMYLYGEEDGKQVRYDIGAAVQSYEVSASAEGYYPLTDDLILFYKEYTDWSFYAADAYGDGTNEDVWMYCCRAMITEDTVLLPENPTEGTLNVDQVGAEWTAPQAGTVCFTVEPADCAVALYDASGTDVLHVIENGYGEIDVTEGDTFVLYPEDYDYEGTALVTFAYKEEEPESGTETNPTFIEWNWTDDQSAATATVEVAAGATCYFAIPYSNVELFINGERYGVMNGSFYTPATFAITNDGVEAASYELRIATPEGTMDNPAELVLGANTAVLDAGSQGYFYTWTAPAAGKLTVTMPEGDWIYGIDNLTSGAYGDIQWSDSEPVVNPAVVSVAKDDVLKIMVNTYDPDNMYNTPAGELTIIAAFEEGEAEEPEVPGNTGTKENPEVLEELDYYYGDISQAQGDNDGYFYTYTAPADGVVTCYFGYMEGVEDYVLDIVVTNQTTSQQKTLLKDGVDNFGMEVTMDVAAGDVVEFNVIALEDAEGNAYPAAELVWCGVFSYPAGTEENPIRIEWLWDDDYINATASVSVEAGKTVYYNGNAGMILTINGSEAEMDEVGIFTITNTTGAAATYELALATPVGEYSNPEVIEALPFEDTNSLAAERFYYYIWTATEDATLVLDVTDGANITVSNLDTYEYFELAEQVFDENYNSSWNVAEELILEVGADQTLKIEVAGLMDWDTWFTPPIDYTLTIDYVVPDSAMIGDVGYATVEDALNAAVSGDVVRLVSDAEISYARVIPGVTLDLNGYTLTAEYVAVFNGGQIGDNSESGSGFLAVEAENVIINANNTQLPVWKEDGYVFSTIDLRRVMTYNITADSFAFGFLPVFPNAVAKNQLADGGLDNGVTIEVRISWEANQGREYRNLIYNEEQVGTIFAGESGTGRFNLTVGGLSAISGLTEVVVEAVVRSTTGVYGVSKGITVKLPN